MTEIRRGSQEQGTNFVSGVVSVAQAATRTADRLSRSLQRHLERVARENDRLDQQRRDRQGAQRDTAAQRDRYLGGGDDAAVSAASSRASGGVPATNARAPVMPVGYRGPSGGEPVPNASAASVNAMRDANRVVAREGTGAYDIRGYGSGRMLRVDYGDGQVLVSNPGTQEMLREVAEQNPRAFPDFASWVNTVMDLRGEPVSALTAERVALARRDWEAGGSNVSTSRAVPFDASFANSDEYTQRRGNVMFSADYSSAPGNEGSRIRTSQPVYERVSESPVSERVPLSEQEVEDGRSDLMRILDRHRRVGYESRSRVLSARERLAPTAPSNEVSIPSMLRTLVRGVIAEGDARHRLETVQRENANISARTGRVTQPKQDSGDGDAKAEDARSIGGLQGVDRLDGFGSGFGSGSAPDSGPAEIVVPGSQTLNRRADRESVEGTQSRLQRLEQRIQSGPLAPVAAAAGIAAGADIPITDNVSISTDGVKGRWRW